MPSSFKDSSLKEHLEKFQQSHLITFFDSLSNEEKESFEAELKKLDLARIQNIFNNTMAGNAGNNSESKLEPLPSSCFDSTIPKGQKEKVKEWRAKGLELIKAGKVAVLLLAGGQGTRLGSSAPKGCYDIGLPSHKSLFQMQGERINRLQVVAAGSTAKCVIPWYVMTSGPTHAETVAFFAKNNYFGLDKNHVIFFQQGTLPCLTKEGKIMLEEKAKIAVAPDGNGGCYAALEKEGVLADMEKRGIEHVHMYCVDNCLVRVADPVFIGYCALKKADCGAKVVPKLSADEPVGVVCRRNDRFEVVEYSEISADIANQKSSDGQLAFRAANIANHYYTRAFLQRVVKEIEPKLTYHVAHKKIPTIDYATGALVKPSSPNGIKLELFVFDVFPFSANFTVLEVPREEDFSPLKNPPGNPQDSPDTSRRDIMNQHKKYLEAVGATVIPEEAKGAVIVEISPLVSYAGEGLESFAGKKLQSPVILNSL